MYGIVPRADETTENKIGNNACLPAADRCRQTISKICSTEKGYTLRGRVRGGCRKAVGM